MGSAPDDTGEAIRPTTATQVPLRPPTGPVAAVSRTPKASKQPPAPRPATERRYRQTVTKVDLWSVLKVSVEGFVHWERSRYSVPPEHVGRTVLVEEGEQRVTVRVGDLILAEHARAPQPGSCMVHPEHIAALWKLCLPPDTPPPPAGQGWQVTFTEGVAQRSLATYEAAVQGAEGAG